MPTKLEALPRSHSAPHLIPQSADHRPALVRRNSCPQTLAEFVAAASAAQPLDVFQPGPAPSPAVAHQATPQSSQSAGAPCPGVVWRLAGGVMACLRGVGTGLERLYAGLHRGAAAVRHGLLQAWHWLHGTPAPAPTGASTPLQPGSPPRLDSPRGSVHSAQTASPSTPRRAETTSDPAHEDVFYAARETLDGPTATLDEVRRNVQVGGKTPIDFEGTQVIDAPLWHVAAVIYDRANASWVPGCIKAEVRSVSEDDTVRGYMAIERTFLGGRVKKRTDIVTDAQLKALPSEALDGAARGLLCSITSVSNQPLTDGFMRVPALRGRFVLRELAPGRTEVNYAVGLDAGIKFPFSGPIIKSISGNQARETLTSLAQRVREPGAMRMEATVRELFPQLNT